ncbi:ABC transporter permease [Roseibium marinum]|uniref:Putative spermidine/putrescine transport system permease protein n=1 Tax=Roseibium marinum TaxID=281252 RepID=A0A2S3V0U9_9HYPH|nr:ABC transporter permease [Roseibium marinum]POF33597.1 putative spermidine/putrescine transport system permease protein [Roseibium marinum]
MKTPGEQKDRTWILAAPGVGYLTVLYALPLGLLLLASFRLPEAFSISAYVDFFGDPFNWYIIWNTLRSALLTTAFCLLIGYPAAFALAWSKGWLQALFLVSLILPLSVGIVVKAFAWTIVLRSDGVLNQALMALGFTDEPVRLIFTETGLIFGAVNVFVPFMIMPVYSVIRLLDPRLAEAARTLGAGPLYVFWKIILPLTVPGIIAGIAFVFSLALAMYVIPTLLVGERFMTLSQQIARSYLYLRNETLGSTVAVVLLVFSLIVIVASQWLAGKVRANT